MSQNSVRISKSIQQSSHRSRYWPLLGTVLSLFRHQRLRGCLHHKCYLLTYLLACLLTYLLTYLVLIILILIITKDHHITGFIQLFQLDDIKANSHLCGSRFGFVNSDNKSTKCHSVITFVKQVMIIGICSLLTFLSARLQKYTTWI